MVGRDTCAGRRGQPLPCSLALVWLWVRSVIALVDIGEDNNDIDNGMALGEIGFGLR